MLYLSESLAGVCILDPGFPMTVFGVPIWAVMVLFAVHSRAISEEDMVRNSLLEFMSKLSNSDGIPELDSGWNSSSNPCQGRWRGIICDDQQRYVTGIALDGYNLSGVLDARFLCGVGPLSASLSVISVSRNRIHGSILEDIGNCSVLTRLLVARNQFSGSIPESVLQMKNLKVLDLSHNQFSGAIPRSRPPALSEFNVSYNNLIGPIPGWGSDFNMSSFIDNPRLCGTPLPYNCSSVELNKQTELVSAPPPELAAAPPLELGKKGDVSSDQIFMFLGYAVISLAILVIAVVCVCKRAKARERERNPYADDNKIAAVNGTMAGLSFSTVELKGKSDFTTSVESGRVSASVAVVASPGLRFDDLLRAPAELLGRGKHGSVYMVVYRGLNLAVKRIKDWPISSSEFRERMRAVNQVKHPTVLPAIAFYSSQSEKLVVYDYQPNGSLFRLIHSRGGRENQSFNWAFRISAAATIADALAFMHAQLQRDGIPHGNLKSSNVLLNENMEPRICEYGLMLEGNQVGYKCLFKADTYAFGVILLELLTGRMALDNGMDLATWVVAVVREEWTVEVFDKKLLHEGVSEERMVNALQVAIRCVDPLPEVMPSMNDVAAALAAIRDDDEQSVEASDLSLTRSFVDL